MTWISDRKTGYFWKHYGHRSGPSIECARSQPCGHLGGDDGAFGVGAGLLESAYQACLQHDCIERVLRLYVRSGFPWFIEV